MKIIWTNALVALLLIGGMTPTVQASRVKDMETALKKAGDDGIMVFLHGVGWDKYSEKRCNEIMADKDVKRVLGRVTYLNYPCIENPTVEQKTALEAVLDGKKIPFPKTYPAILWLDKQGRCLCTIQGEQLTRTSNLELAKLLAERLTTIRTMVELEKKADKETGLERARLLGESRALPGINPPDAAMLAEMAKHDPHDNTGYLCYFKTGEYDISAAVLAMKFEQSQAFVKEVVASQSYSPLTKQAALIAMLGQWRTQGTRDQLNQMRTYAEKVIEINPDNYHAGSARYMLDEWFKQFTLESGWFPALIPKDSTPMYLEGSIPIKASGTYEVLFQHTGGRYALTIESVTLYDGDTLVSKDEHTGVTGTKNTNNTYTLVAKKSVKTPRIAIVVNQGEKTGTQGMITIRKAK